MGLRKMIDNLLKERSNDAADEACVLIPDGGELEKAIRTKDKLMVLFYASWCPFSQAFLGTFRKHAAAGDPCYARIVVDGGDPVTEKYAIDVFPTVLFFEKGRLVRRLDGTHNRGLRQDQLEEFARLCDVK